MADADSQTADHNGMRKSVEERDGETSYFDT